MTTDPIHIACRHCDNHCMVGTLEKGSDFILEISLPSGWVPHAESKTSRIEIYFVCPECEHPKLNKRPGRPTHPPPPRKKH